MNATSTLPPAGPGPIARLRRDVVEKLLEQADFVLVVVSPVCPGVELPAALMQTGQSVALHIGRRLAIPIPDLRLDDHGISGTLSFQGTPFACRLPWASIIQVSLEEEHLIWITSTPPPTPDEEHAGRPRPETRPKLRLV